MLKRLQTMPIRASSDSLWPFCGLFPVFFGPDTLGWTAKNGHNDVMASLPIIGAINDMTFLRSIKQ